MELPEQDRQAFIDAARRRSQPQQGGAAFGVYPSSGKRPEKLNASRDVNMPAQAARGWAAGLLGLPGDIESLGRLGLGLAGADVSETPVLPTSDFYREYLPGYDPAPAARAASGLGALAGGAGATRVAGAAVKGAKATGKALGPKAAEMAESYLKKSGLAPELIAYQGSPHKFAPEPDAPFGKFKSEKIGTGEGAQAYGHGHYTAEARNVAQSYADVLASPRNRVGEGRGVYIEPSPISGGKYMLATRSEIGQPRGLAADATQFIYPEKEFSSIAAAVKFAKRKGLLSKDERPKLTAVNEDRKYVPVTKAADVAEPEYTQFIASDPGYLYTVDIPDEKVAMMLDLDRPLAEQSPEVQKALSNVSGAEYAAEYFAKNRKEAPTGADLQEFLRLSGMNPPEISAKMLEAGIPGVKYLDEGSRGPSGSGRWNIKFPDGTEQIFNFKPNDDVLKQMNATAEPAGTRNFVIFPGEEESVKIIDRKAEGGLVQDTDAIAAKLTGMDKDKALTHALRMANAKQEAHMAAGGLAKVLKGAKKAKDAEKTAEAAKPAVKGPQAEALETARKNAVTMLGLPENNTAMDRAKALGFVNDQFHGTKADFTAFKPSKKSARFGPGVYTSSDPQRASNYAIGYSATEGENVIPLLTKDPDFMYAGGAINVFNEPQSVRSRFAAFDPARVNENDLLGAADPALLAGTAVASGIGLGALGQMDKRKPEQPEQKKAAGGLAKLLKGAKAAPAAKPAQIGNYQALPLQLPRAPNLPPQELTKAAERVARQQMGEHVRKVPNKSENLAGRSMKEVERLKNLDIELQPTKDIPTPTVVPEKKGEVRIGLPGDISIADQILMSVDNLPIGAQQEGGALYGFGKMDLPDPAFWASNRVPAQQVQNKATDVANVFDTPDVLAMHLAMGHEAMNFAQHFADANLRAIQQMPVHPESAKLFNEIVRAGNPKTGEKFPHFPGVENYEETYKALQQDPEMRKWFNNRMKVDKITGPLGLPSGKEIEYAVMEPALSNMEPSMVGLSVGRLRPGAELIPGSAHKTYSHDIPGLALGRTQELLPVDLAFPDAAAHIRKTKRPDDFTATIQKLYPHQVVDQQYIDQVGEYYNRLRQIRGYKKGGTVKKSGLSVLNKAII